MIELFLLPCILASGFFIAFLIMWTTATCDALLFKNTDFLSSLTVWLLLVMLLCTVSFMFNASIDG